MNLWCMHDDMSTFPGTWLVVSVGKKVPSLNSFWSKELPISAMGYDPYTRQTKVLEMCPYHAEHPECVF